MSIYGPELRRHPHSRPLHLRPLRSHPERSGELGTRVRLGGGRNSQEPRELRAPLASTGSALRAPLALVPTQPPPPPPLPSLSICSWRARGWCIAAAGVRDARPGPVRRIGRCNLRAPDALAELRGGSGDGLDLAPQASRVACEGPDTCSHARCLSRQQVAAPDTMAPSSRPPPAPRCSRASTSSRPRPPPAAL